MLLSCPNSSLLCQVNASCFKVTITVSLPDTIDLNLAELNNYE